MKGYRHITAAGAAFGLAIVSGIVAIGGTSVAQDGGWNATEVATPQAVSAVQPVGGEAFVYAHGWYRAEPCYDTVCLVTGRPPDQITARDGIPNGTVARAVGTGIVEAWYGAPTSRYDHGILGDRIEGGSLVVIDDDGRRHELALPEDQVFEDLTPRIADFNGDGRNEVLTIRTGIATGAAIAIYGVVDGVLTEAAAIPPIGRTHRWLNIAGIADFNGDGRLDIALVKTPHIGGTLEIWTMQGGALIRLAAAAGFSNHAIYSTELGMSAVADFNGDGIADLAVPDASRAAIRIVHLGRGAIVDLGTVALGVPVNTGIGVVEADGPALLLGLVDGRLVLIRQTMAAQ